MGKRRNRRKIFKGLNEIQELLDREDSRRLYFGKCAYCGRALGSAYWQGKRIQKHRSMFLALSTGAKETVPGSAQAEKKGEPPMNQDLYSVMAAVIGMISALAFAAFCA